MPFLIIDSFCLPLCAARRLLAHPDFCIATANGLRRSCCRVALATLATLLAHGAQGAQDNQVNERLPVSKAERELHWEVDCTALVTNLASGAFSCPLDDGLLRELKLCSFIYQPPGGNHELPCPNYRELLKRARQGSCEELLAFTPQLNCQNTPRGHQ